MGSDPQYAKYPNLKIATDIFTITNPRPCPCNKPHGETAERLLASIKEHKQAPLYKYLADPSTGLFRSKGVDALPWDESLYNELKKSNDEELEAIQKEATEAEETAGESEVTQALGKKAEFYARILDKENALKAYEAVLERTATAGVKIDIVLAMIRMNMFFDDKLAVAKGIDRAKTLVDSGGDWDRRNRLKAYQGIHLLSIRQFSLAAPLLLDSMSTFTSNELCEYETLVLYAVLAGTISLSRVDFKTKVIDSAEVLAVFGSRRETNPEDNDPHKPSAGWSSLETLVNSFYICDYRPLFTALADVEEQFLARDRLLAEHCVYFTREMRRRAYAQLLESYRVRSINSMAEEFGVDPEWLDRDLARFIPTGELNCTIDRVGGVIETNRPDNKNRQYQEVVRLGDQVLTKLQKFGQVVRLRGSERV